MDIDGSSLSSFVDSKKPWKKLSQVVDDFHAAEDGEPWEEPHGASNEPQGRLGGHPLILDYQVKSRRGQVDLDKLDGLVGCVPLWIVG